MHRRKFLTLTLVLAAFVVMTGRAQTPPNLSGTWRPQNPMAGQANPFEFTITQTADSVTIRTPLNNPDTVTFHQNAETRTPIGGGQRGAGGATEMSIASRWDGAQLEVNTALLGGPGGARHVGKQSYSMSGDVLTLETSNALGGNGGQDMTEAERVDSNEAGPALRRWWRGSAPLEGFAVSEFSDGDISHPVYVRGKGPGVLLIGVPVPGALSRIEQRFDCACFRLSSNRPQSSPSHMKDTSHAKDLHYVPPHGG